MGAETDKIFAGFETKSPAQRSQVDALLSQFDAPPEPPPGTEFQTITTSTGTEQAAVFTGRKPETIAISGTTVQPISTITGKPLDAPARLPKELKRKPAGFLDLWKKSFVDDPEAQREIFARARFPEIPIKEAVQRYGSDKKGNILFKDDDGVWKPETPTTFMEQAKDLTASLSGGSLPSTLLGLIGASTTRPSLAVLGAAGGEAIRKLVGKLAFDEKQTGVEIATDIALEGLLGLAGEGSGIVFNKAINKALATGTKKQAAKIAGLTQKDARFLTPKELKRIKVDKKLGLRSVIDNPEEMARLQAVAEKHGVSLSVPELTKSPELLRRFNQLADMDEAADLIQEYKKTQNLQIQNAVPGFLDTLSKEVDPYVVGKDIVVASQKAIGDLVTARKSLVRPYYKKAFQEASDKVVDTAPSIAVIDDLLLTIPEKTPSFTALKKVRSVIAESGGNMAKLDRVKRDSIDEILRKTKASPTLKRELAIVKDALTTEMDKTSPSYAVARFMHGMALGPEQAAQKGLVGSLANLEGENIIGATTQMLSGARMRPRVVEKIKAAIRGQDPAAWDAGVRDFLAFRFNRFKDSQVTDVSNIGGAFRKAVFGSPNERDILRAALSKDQFSSLKDFMEVMQRTGLTFAKESTTAIRERRQGKLVSELGTGVRQAIASPISTLENALNSITDVAVGKNARLLAEALIDPTTALQLKKIKQLSPGSESFIRGVTVFAALLAPETTERIQNVRENNVNQ